MGRNAEWPCIYILLAPFMLLLKRFVHFETIGVVYLYFNILLAHFMLLLKHFIRFETIREVLSNGIWEIRLSASLLRS